MIANETQTLRDEYSRDTEILDAEYKQLSASLDDVIKTYEKLHVEERHQLKNLLQNINICLMQHQENSIWNVEPISLQLMDPNSCACLHCS
jgi:hypothetical protein